MKRPARARHTTTGVAPAYSLKATAVVRVGSNAPAAVEKEDGVVGDALHQQPELLVGGVRPGGNLLG